MTQMTKRMRWIVLGFLLALSIINFIDRQTLSVLAPHLRQQFHLSNTDYGRIVAAFSFGMMAAEFPMGMLMDRLGARFGLAFAVAWWSLATAAHAVGNSVMSFGLFRFWMGTGETGTFSGSLKGDYALVSERRADVRGGSREQRDHARINDCAAAGGGDQLFLWLEDGVSAARVVGDRVGYRMAFDISRFGAGGARGGKPVGKEAAPRTRDLLAEARRTWALMLCRFLVGPVVQFYWYWLPNYLVSARGMTLVAVGALTVGLPYLSGDEGSQTGGWTADGLLKRGMTIQKARGISMVTGGVLCLGSLAVVAAPSIPLALMTISIVMFGHTFLSASMFAAIGDMFPESAVGRVTGLTGISGGLGGILFPLLTGYLVDRYSYGPAFLFVALMPLAGAAALFGIAPKLRPWSTTQR